MTSKPFYILLMDEDDDEEDNELGKLSKDDKAGWVMGTISKTL